MSNLTAPRLLIADDEELLRMSLGDLIQEDLPRCEVLLAEDGVKAMEILRRERDAITHVLTDFHMPKANGNEVVRVAREVGVRAIAVMSALIDQVEDDGVIKWSKPVPIEDMLNWLCSDPSTELVSAPQVE